MTPDARELHRVITASVRELLETARLERQAGPMDAAQLERLLFRAAAPIVQSVEPLTEAQRGELLPNIARDVGGLPGGANAMTAAAGARVPPQGAGGGAMKSAAMLVALVLVLAPISASAECPWVLWVKHEHWVSNDIEALDEGGVGAALGLQDSPGLRGTRINRAA